MKVKLADKDNSYIRMLAISSKEQSFLIPFNLDPSTFYISVDPDFELLATVEFERPVQMIINQLRYDGTYGRIQAVRSLAREASYAAVDAIAEALQNDSFWGVRAEAAKALGEIGTDYAFEHLSKGLADKNAKARRAVVSAMGKFRTEKSAEMLIELLKRGDESYFVEAESAKSLGKTKQKIAFDAIVEALSRPSYNEVIQTAAVEGLAELGDERALQYIVERTSKKYNSNVRRAATIALGKLGTDKQEVRELLLNLLRDDWFRVRAAAASALVERKDFSAIHELEKAAQAEIDGRVRRSFREAISKLRTQQPISSEFKTLRDEIERLKEENRKIMERLESLERAKKSESR